MQRLYSAARWQSHDMVRAISNDDTALHLAALYGHAHVVKWLVVEAQAPLNVLGSVSLFDISSLFFCFTSLSLSLSLSQNEYTPLLCACHYGHLEVVKFLVGHSASTTTSDGHGRSALHIAAKYGRLSVAQFLVDHCGADVFLRDDVSMSTATILIDSTLSPSLSLSLSLPIGWAPTLNPRPLPCSQTFSHLERECASGVPLWTEQRRPGCTGTARLTQTLPQANYPEASLSPSQ